MLVERKKLIEHLSKVNCGGLLKDAVLSDRFKCTGFSVSQDLLVVAAGIEKVSPLKGEVGVVNLELLLKVLDIGDDEKVSFEVEGDHLVLQSPEGTGRGDRVVKLVNAAPRVIGSRADLHLVENVLKSIPAETKWMPLGFPIVTGIQEAITKLGAELVYFFPGAKGTRVVVGEESANSISFKFPELTAPEEFKLLFHSTLIAAVLKQVTDYTKAEICLTGPDSVVPIREGSYMFVMSPAKEV